MTHAGDQQHEPRDGFLAVLLALVRFVLGCVRRGYISREAQRRVARQEREFVSILFGGRLRQSHEFQDMPADEQRLVRRRMLADYFRIRRLRRNMHGAKTIMGVIRRIASLQRRITLCEGRGPRRRRASLDAICLPHVASTSEPLAGAPP